MPDPVFVVYEGPDMTYYGDAEIHGVYATREAAEAAARTLDEHWRGEGYECIRVAECEVIDGV